MSDGMNPEQPDAPGRRGLLLALVVMFLATIWMLALSRYFLDCSHGLLFSRQDVLFESDAANFLNRMASEKWMTPFHSFAIVHPLAAYFWKSIALAQSYLFDLIMPRQMAALNAVRIVIAGVAGAGIGCLALLAIRNGVGLMKLIPLLAMYFFFTANTITSLPDHFGLSSGLLSINFAILVLRKHSPSNLILLTLMAALVTGTTITNFALPVLCLLFALHQAKDFRGIPWWKYRIPLAAAFVLVAIFCGALVMERYAGDFVTQFRNNRFVESPARAVVYVFAGILYPAVGPVAPVVFQQDRSFAMLSYEPLNLLQYDPVQTIGAIAWLVLLAVSVRSALKERTARPYVYLLLIWIGFNLIFHNLWGDEFFLFTPHWSWALISLVFFGARNVSWKFVMAVAVPILIAQMYTLMHLGKALASIRY